MDYKTSISNDGDDIIYVNVVALNNSNQNQRADIDISRTAPIVTNTSEYLLSIQKFRIPTVLYPLFIFPSYPLTVTISYLGSVLSTNLIFTQTVFNELDLIYPKGIYYYQAFADMINTAITSTYNALPIKPSGLNIPFIAYNTNNQLFEMTYPSQWVDVYPFNNPAIAHLFFNTDLNWYFQSMPTITRINQSPRDIQMIVENTNINTVLLPDGVSKGYIMRQEYSTIGLDNSLTNISISSNNIPVTPVSIATVNLGGSSSSSTAISIIEDFDPISEAGSQRSYQQYTSQNNRYSTLLEKQSLYNINLAFYTYSQEINSYFPVYIPPHFTLSVKLMFKKKKLNY